MHLAPFAAAWLLAVALAGCGADETPPAPAAEPAPAPAEPAPAPAEPAPAPVPAVPAPVPVTGGADPATAEAGAKSYALLCASCHGATGNADTPMAETLDPRPVAHSDGNYMNGLSDEYLFRVIKEGGAAVGKSPLMAPWGGTLSDEQIRGVVAYVRTLADPPYPGGD
jgi:mono/diheme cytochrome c family protein